VSTDERGTWALGYGTNGFADHTLNDALDVIAGSGYTAVALTLGHPHLDPFADDWEQTSKALAEDLSRRGLRVVVETGARYVLDPWRKHRPTLVDREAGARIAFLRRAVEIAQILDAECVSLWSGILPEDVTADERWALMVDRLRELVEFAEERGVVLAVEPEPGMLVETVADANRLLADLGDPASVGITFDLGHCVAVEPGGVVAALRAAGARLRNVQIDDMVPGVHEHLELGSGELDLAAALDTLRDLGFSGVAAIELPRHSYDAPRLARSSIEAVERAIRGSRHPWTTAAIATVTADPSRLGRLFAEAGRKVGRDPLSSDDPLGYHGSVDDEARAAIIEAVHDSGESADLARTLYHEGDDAERRGVLRGLSLLARDGRLDGDWREASVELVTDALRTNDTRLVAAAMGEVAEVTLDDHSWRHGVLKLVFMGVPLSVVSGLERRRDDELAAMAGRFAQERRAAGRVVPDDMRLIDVPLSER
jgi:sugar phosphate isomerase/epimerase